MQILQIVRQARFQQISSFIVIDGAKLNFESKNQTFSAWKLLSVFGARKGMIKVMGLIVGAIFMMAFGVYFLMNANLPELVFPFFQLPNIEWGVVGFVTLVGGITVFGTAFAASKFNR